MRTFDVEICETLTKVITVTAVNSAEAVEQIEEAYRESEIVLDSDDFADYTIKVL